MNAQLDKRRLVRMIALVALAWVAILLVVSRLEHIGHGEGIPRLIHYPGTEDVQEQTATNLGMRKYWFRLNEEYPSKSVYYFYQRELEPRGWKQMGQNEPKWGRTVEGGQTRDLFETLWVSPDKLWTIELQMMSVVKPVKGGGALAGEEREQGIQTYVTLRRALHPGILFQENERPPQTEGVKAPGQ